MSVKKFFFFFCCLSRVGVGLLRDSEGICFCFILFLLLVLFMAGGLFIVWNRGIGFNGFV